jgi:glycosyltransferase involved in cell wall biosynthesis
MPMKKITYVSVDNFLDVDLPIVKELNKSYRLYWILYYQTHSTRMFSKEEVIQFVSENSIDIQIVDIQCRFSNPKLLKIAWQTIKMIQKRESEIVYFQTFIDPYLPVLTRLLLPVNKVVVAVHDVILHKKFSSVLGIFFHNMVLAIFHNYHLYSENQVDIFKRKHKTKKILVAPLYLKDFGKPKGLIPKNSDPVNFLFFGSIRHNKGLEFLIEAGNKLAQEFKNFKITIAGYTSEQEYYRNLIEYPDRFKVRFEIIPNSEIADYFTNSDFLVLPYRDVTQSGPLLISYNYNLPVIASDFPGFREYIIHGYNGLLFEPNNPLELYKTLRFVVESSQEKIETYKQNLKTFVTKEINLQEIIAKYIHYFDQL